MCLKQTSVSHSSTESEVISLHAGSRMDGIPALDLWDLIKSIALFFFIKKKFQHQETDRAMRSMYQNEDTQQPRC